MDEIWVAVDSRTDRIVAFGTQSEATRQAKIHTELSDNETIVRKLRIGITLLDYR